MPAPSTTFFKEKHVDGGSVGKTIFADGGEKIERMGRDRQIMEVSGSAAIPTTMSYGIAWDTDRGFFARWSSSSVSENGAEIARQQRWTDPLDRVYKVVYLDGSADVTTYNVLGASFFRERFGGKSHALQIRTRWIP